MLRSANIPVMTVGPEAHPSVAGKQQSVILHATTLRETSRPSAVLACQIASTISAKLVMLHVLPPLNEVERKSTPSSIDASALKALNRLAAEAACGCSSPIETHVIRGNASIEILDEAAQLQASLIVLGATERSAFQNLTRDRTIYRVLAHARCPVLTLREVSAEIETPVFALAN